MNRFRLQLTPMVTALLATLLIGFSVPIYAVQNTTTKYPSYDANGNPLQIASPLDTVANPVKTDLSYDALDRVFHVVQPKPAANIINRPDIFMGYDGQDRLIQVNDPRALITDYTLDGLGNQLALTSPDSGATNALYDAAGNLKSKTDARVKVTTYSYDPLNRLTTINTAPIKNVTTNQSAIFHW